MDQSYRTEAVSLLPSVNPLGLRARAIYRPLHAIRPKRLFDIVGASLCLIFFAPLLAVLYLLVRSDGGPALFGHTRIGARGRAFTCWKFRSMVVDADSVLHEVLERDPLARREWENDFKLRNDRRVTRLGAILRTTSLDELPQLFNVLRGEMSLVGPRPIVSAEVPRYGQAIDAYAQCRPGLTGLWQVSGRNDVTYNERVRLDVTYVSQWSLLLDVRIVLKTLSVIVKRSGAY